MYGNFDAIKRRKELRKETTTARKDRVNRVKNGISRSEKKNVFSEVPEKQVNNAIKSIRERMQKEDRRKSIQNLIIIGIIIIAVTFLFINYIYPFLFN